MITSKWFKGNKDLGEVVGLRKEIFEVGGEDFYDEFSFNIGIYEEDEELVGIGRLFTKDGKFYIDNFGVKEGYRNKYYGDFMLRILIRKAYDLGIERVYVECRDDTSGFFEKLGFVEEKKQGDILTLYIEGDITSECCKG